jgi:hypothetical protein
MTGDRLANSFRRVVHRVLADDTQNAPINFGRLHAARVVAANEDGVAVIFDDARLGSKTGVPLSSDPGLSLQVLVNTRVLVGWADGDEAAPFVAAIWLGDGGLRRAVQAFTEEYVFSGPLVRATGDVQCVHDIAGGPAPTPTPLLPGVTITVSAGGDRFMELTVIVADNPIPSNTTFADVAFGTAYTKPFGVIIGATDGKPPGYAKLPNGFALKAGSAAIPVGTYTYTVKTGA